MKLSNIFSKRPTAQTSSNNENLSPDKKIIRNFAEKVVKDYGETLILLGKE